MKRQKFSILFLLFALPFFTSAQDAQRGLTPEQSLEIQKGDLSNFEYYLLRFETAREENDLKSMESLRKELVKMMQKEIGAVETSKKLHDDKPSPESFLKTASTSDMATQSEAIKNAFNAYKAWVKKEIAQKEGQQSTKH